MGQPSAIGSKPLLLTARILFAALLSPLFLSGCGQQAEAPPPQIDYAKAKAVSDGAVDCILRKDSDGLYQKLDVGFHLVVKNPADVRAVLEKMDTLYGHPLKCDYKAAQAGLRTDETWKRPTRTFLYAVKTSKYPLGKYFLKIEVVRAFSSESLDVSGFGFFTFKEGTEAPSYLK